MSQKDLTKQVMHNSPAIRGKGSYLRERKSVQEEENSKGTQQRAWAAVQDS